VMARAPQRHLPDTFDEGSFGPWEFTALSRNGDEWKLSFTNSIGADSTFEFAGDCVEGAHNAVVSDWFECINSAILDCRQRRRLRRPIAINRRPHRSCCGRLHDAWSNEDGRFCCHVLHQLRPSRSTMPRAVRPKL
jgi:hypothetical protein